MHIFFFTKYAIWLSKAGKEYFISSLMKNADKHSSHCPP